jgi:hypothetical protein
MSQTAGGETGPAGEKAKKPIYKRWWAWVIAGSVVIIIVAVAAGGGNNNNKTAASTTPTAASTGESTTSAPPTTAAPTTAAPTATVATRTVTGKATTLGAGNFTAGADVAPGLYDVTTGPGQSGNFIVQGTNMYNEILGGDSGVPKIRAQISKGDQIQISGLSQVIFTPVTAPYVTTHAPVTLYAGTWTVGQDLGAGRYVATPGAGQSGNFIIDNEGVNEILGGSSSTGGVPNVTFTVNNGDVIEISGLGQVKLTPS